MITNKALKRRYHTVMIGIIISALILIEFLLLYQPNYYPAPTILTKNQVNPVNTGNTVRIFGNSMYENVIALTQVTYPSSFSEDRPNAIILVREDKKEDGLLAASVTHHPINAPILFVQENDIPEAVWEEMDRLNPQGLFVDDNIKVILVGDIGEKVAARIKEKKWGIRYIKGSNPFELSKNIDEYLAVIHGDHRDVVTVSTIAAAEYAFPQVSWNAHMGDAFFFINEDSIPKEVKEALSARFGKAYIYLLGSNTTFSDNVLIELAQYGHIQKIPNNNDIYSNSTGFAGYKDVGKNFGWWISKRTRNFGWGIAEAGHNFIFINAEDWHLAVSASVLSHKGKHGPMLLIQRDMIPEPIKRYLLTVRPKKTTPQEQLYNHGWIIGGTDLITLKTQAEIDELLSYEGGR